MCDLTVCYSSLKMYWNINRLLFSKVLHVEKGEARTENKAVQVCVF